MKRIVVLVYFCLICGVTFAQGQHADTSKLIIRDGVYTGKEPLYIINGAVVQSIKTINPDSILNIQVLKSDRAVSIYGQRAINGVVVIQTKAAFKPAKPSGTDTLHVVDGIAVDKIANINPDSILCITVLKDVTTGGKNVVTERPQPVVIIETKTGAKKAYQKKFGLLSKEYAAYIKEHNEIDSKVTYVVNGQPVNNDLKALSDLKSDSITYIRFVLTGKVLPTAGIPGSGLLIIKTKAVIKQ